MSNLWATKVEDKKTFIVTSLALFTTILISILVKTIKNERKHDDIAEGNKDPVESAENDNTITLNLWNENFHSHKYYTNIHPMSLSSSPVIPMKNASDFKDCFLKINDYPDICR
jgi:hypothetical protein